MNKMLEALAIQKFILILVVYINGTVYTFETKTHSFIHCKSVESYQVIMFNRRPDAVVVFSECKERIMV